MNDHPLPKPLVKAEAIASYFSTSARNVRHQAQNGTIPCVRIGKLVRFDMDAVIAAVADAEKRRKGGAR